MDGAVARNARQKLLGASLTSALQGGRGGAAGPPASRPGAPPVPLNGSLLDAIRHWFRRQNRAPLEGVGPRPVRWGELALFVLIAFGLSWGSWMGLRPVFPGLALRTFIAMFGPTFAALAVVRLRSYRRPRQRPRMTREWIILGLLASVMAAVLVSALVGAGFWLSIFSGDLRTPGSSGQNLFQVLPFPAALGIYWLTAFGEEYGWRGFLVPLLAPLGGARTSLVIAIVFAAWHAPAILIDGFNYPRHHVLGLLDMFVFAIPFTIILVWLRSATRSIVAPASAHAALNILTGIVYASTARTTSLYAAPVGLLGTLPLAGFALLLLLGGRLWRRSDPTRTGLRAGSPPNTEPGAGDPIRTDDLLFTKQLL
jgi:membrane protease YdiL (CAAX protease family)